jgi:hypothetical protein
MSANSPRSSSSRSARRNHPRNIDSINRDWYARQAAIAKANASTSSATSLHSSHSLRTTSIDDESVRSESVPAPGTFVTPHASVVAELPAKLPAQKYEDGLEVLHLVEAPAPDTASFAPSTHIVAELPGDNVHPCVRHYEDGLEVVHPGMAPPCSNYPHVEGMDAPEVVQSGMAPSHSLYSQVEGMDDPVAVPPPTAPATASFARGAHGAHTSKVVEMPVPGDYMRHRTQTKHAGSAHNSSNAVNIPSPQQHGRATLTQPDHWSQPSVLPGSGRIAQSTLPTVTTHPVTGISHPHIGTEFFSMPATPPDSARRRARPSPHSRLSWYLLRKLNGNIKANRVSAHSLEHSGVPAIDLDTYSSTTGGFRIISATAAQNIRPEHFSDTPTKESKRGRLVRYWKTFKDKLHLARRS